jgi:hypothetical protein
VYIHFHVYAFRSSSSSVKDRSNGLKTAGSVGVEARSTFKAGVRVSIPEEDLSARQKSSTSNVARAKADASAQEFAMFMAKRNSIGIEMGKLCVQYSRYEEQFKLLAIKTHAVTVTMKDLEKTTGQRHRTLPPYTLQQKDRHRHTQSLTVLRDSVDRKYQACIARYQELLTQYFDDVPQDKMLECITVGAIF